MKIFSPCVGQSKGNQGWPRCLTIAGSIVPILGNTVLAAMSLIIEEDPDRASYVFIPSNLGIAVSFLGWGRCGRWVGQV